MAEKGHPGNGIRLKSGCLIAIGLLTLPLFAFILGLLLDLSIPAGAKVRTTVQNIPVTYQEFHGLRGIWNLHGGGRSEIRVHLLGKTYHTAFRANPPCGFVANANCIVLEEKNSQTGDFTIVVVDVVTKESKSYPVGTNNFARAIMSLNPINPVPDGRATSDGKVIVLWCEERKGWSGVELDLKTQKANIIWSETPPEK